MKTNDNIWRTYDNYINTDNISIKNDDAILNSNDK